MFYHTVREYKSVRYKGYDIFLELKANNMLIASCYHDNGYNYRLYQKKGNWFIDQVDKLNDYKVIKTIPYENNIVLKVA